MATADSRLILSKLAEIQGSVAELQAGMGAVQELRASVAELQAGMGAVQAGMGSLNQRLFKLENAKWVAERENDEDSGNCWSNVEPWHDYDGGCCCDDSD